MRTKVQKWGNSAAIRIPAGALRGSKLTLGQEVELEPEDGTLVIRPANPSPEYSLDALLAGITPDNLNVDQGWEADPPMGGEAL